MTMIRRLSEAVRPRRAPGLGHGFTLLEILVVVLIIGIVLTLATLAQHDDINERLKTEARRLAALPPDTDQGTVLEGNEMAVDFTQQGYSFQILKEEK